MKNVYIIDPTSPVGRAFLEALHMNSKDRATAKELCLLVDTFQRLELKGLFGRHHCSCCFFQKT
jgi:hypothetical protein